MITANLPPNFANAVSPFSPVGKEPVGEENKEAKNTPLKPVEELADSASIQKRRSPEDINLSETDQQARLRLEKENRAELENARESRKQEAMLSEVRQLAARDREVRAHELAHAAVGGQYAGAPQYTFKRGPDGVSYAIAGEVSIDTSRIPGNPEATIEKAQLIRRAALAPAEPSAQDRRVAAQAAQMEAEARKEITERQHQEQDIKDQENRESVSQQEEPPPNQTREISQSDDDQETAADRFAELNTRNAQLNRQLVEITRDINRPGGLLDQTV